MTDVPEYLLRRSRERREALGLAPKGGGAPDAPTDAAGDAPATASPSTAPVAAAEAPAPATAAVPASASPAASSGAVAVADRGPRSGVPYWMMPVLIILPIWGFLYVGSFGSRADVVLTPAQVGARVYTTNCASCHGAQGEGGAGPALAGGDSKVTFPNEADHIAWVETGSASKKGQPYGDPARPGGPRIAASGGMPGFKGPLTEAEIAAVVTYERESL